MGFRTWRAQQQSEFILMSMQTGAKVDLASVVLGWDKALGTADHLISKVKVLAEREGISEDEVLDWRLAPDMYPLRSQLQFVADLAWSWSTRAVGLEVPSASEVQGGTTELRELVASVRKCLTSMTIEQFEGRDGMEFTVNLGIIEPTMPLGRWVLGFANTNILFHLSIAYAILRSRGVTVGKADLFAGGL